MSKQFTPDQIQDYIDFGDVRSRGAYNMFDPRARQITGLSREDYIFVMKNYLALEAQHAAEQQAEDAHILAQADSMEAP